MGYHGNIDTLPEGQRRSSPPAQPSLRTYTIRNRRSGLQIASLSSFSYCVALTVSQKAVRYPAFDAWRIGWPAAVVFKYEIYDECEGTEMEVEERRRKSIAGLALLTSAHGSVGVGVEP